MNFNTIIGQAARQEDFFPRPKITSEIWSKLDKGSNLLLVAPRRVGKSSLLFNLLDKPKNNHIVVYYTSESVNNLNEFYKKLFHHVLEILQGKQKYKAKASAFSKDFISRIKEIGLADFNLTFGESSFQYLNELNNLLSHIELGNDKLIILIDEFAQTVENIIRDSDEKSAILFLQAKREIRQAPQLAKKIQFVYAGSIGLENIVSRINGINFINDLTPIPVSPLSISESKQLIDKIIDDSNVSIEDEVIDYLLNTIEWHIPFYFQIILDEAAKILTDKNSTQLTKEVIDKSVEYALKQRIYFEHWFTRLRNAYKGSEFSFVKELLNLASDKKTIPSTEIFNLAVKYKLENFYTDLVNALKHDGYINNNDEPKTYRFNSPLLRQWWYNNVAN